MKRACRKTFTTLEKLRSVADYGLNPFLKGNLYPAVRRAIIKDDDDDAPLCMSVYNIAKVRTPHEYTLSSAVGELRQY